jgi:hypothetical protein
MDTSKFGKVKRINFVVSKINYCQGISAIKQTLKCRFGHVVLWQVNAEKGTLAFV